MDLELRQLQYFHTVAQLEHMTQAARRLMVAQSAVSRQIRLLEEELGGPLFIRDQHRIRLSGFGRRFLVHTERILRAVDLAMAEAQEFRNAETGLVRLGFPHSVGVHYIPELLRAFRAAWPQVRFDLSQLRVRDLIEQLRTGDIELGVVTPWDEALLPAGFTGVPLYEETMVAVIPVDHPLCSKPSIALRDLRDEPFILFKPGYTLRQMVLDACMAAGFVPKIALEAEETDTIRAFVRAGFGVSVLPPAAMSGSLDGLCECRVTDGPVQRTVGLTWLASGSLSAAGQRFAQFAAARGRQDLR